MRSAKLVYPSVVACDVCRVTPRMLDHWVRTEVIRPAAVFECEPKHGDTRRRKAYHLFNLDNLVQIRVVRELREVGVPLQRIRFAIEKLRELRGDQWQSAWLVTDGRELFEQSEDDRLVTCLQKGRLGQMAWSVIALKNAYTDVQQGLDRPQNRPFPLERFDGKRVNWDQGVRSA